MALYPSVSQFWLGGWLSKIKKKRKGKTLKYKIFEFECACDLLSSISGREKASYALLHVDLCFLISIGMCWIDTMLFLLGKLINWTILLCENIYVFDTFNIFWLD